MRVLIVHNFYQLRGGEDSVVLEELSMLKANGVDVELFAVDSCEIGSALDRLLVGLQIIYNPLSRRELSKKLAVFAPDLVHVHNLFPLLSPSVFDACRHVGVPIVMTLHNFRILCPTAFLHSDAKNRERSLRHSCWWTVPRRAYRNSLAATFALATAIELHKRIGTWRHKVDKFIALSEHAKNKFAEGGIPANLIAVKPNFVARPSTFPQRQRNGALFVGRLDEQKGVRVLLRAWENIDYPLRIIGEGPLSHLSLENSNASITWLGKLSRQAVQEEMQAAKFLVLPSMWHEMFPMTVLEAYSCGLPVVCSDLPSLRNLVQPHVTGLTFPPGDYSKLAEILRWAVSKPDVLDEYGRNGLRTYEECYTPEANCQRLFDIYHGVLSAGSTDGVHQTS